MWSKLSDHISGVRANLPPFRRLSPKNKGVSGAELHEYLLLLLSEKLDRNEVQGKTEGAEMRRQKTQNKK